MMDTKRLTTGKLREHVQESFDHLRKALAIREKLLLRQVDVLQSQSQKVTINEIKFIPENEQQVLNSIRSFGKFNLENFNFVNDLFVNEDYICPSIDHDIMFKCLKQDNFAATATAEEEEKNQHEIVVDFTSNKFIIKENANFLNDSIINITINESKELLEKSNMYKVDEKMVKIDLTVTEPPLSPLMDKSKQNKQVTVSSTTQTEQHQQQQHRPKTNNNSIKNVSNLTIGNCTGTLNLKNISNLTINTCQNANVTGYELPHQDQNSTENECGFYNRLITENKLLKDNFMMMNNGVNIPKNRYSFGNMSISSSESINDSNCNKIISSTNKLNNSTSTIPLMLNIAGSPGGAVLADGDTIIPKEHNIGAVNTAADHPIQIQQWLQQIISETETEPMQNTEILEHSRIDTH